MVPRNVQFRAKYSTSKVLKERITFLKKFSDLLEINAEEVDVVELIRILNDEYKKVKEEPFIPNQSAFQTKSNTVSTAIRNLANCNATEGAYADVLTVYTRSIAYAKGGSETLTLGYSTRANLLYRLHLYDQCVGDINRALAEGYLMPNMKANLRKCMYQCFVERREASNNQIASVILQPRPGPMYEVVKAKAADAIDCVDDAEREWRTMCKFENLTLNAFSKMRLASDESRRGSHPVAAKDLKAGEVIATQEYFALFLESNLISQRCSYCLILCAALIPCPSCTEMMYCSEYCRDLAYKLYHRLECAIMFCKRRCNKSTNDLEFYVVRMLLIGTQQGAQLGNLMQRMTVRDLFTRDLPKSDTFVDEYATVLLRYRTYSPGKMKKYVPFAATMVAILEEAGYFDGDPTIRADREHHQDTLTEAKIFTASLLLNHIVGLSRHFFYLTTVTDLYSSETDKLGRGITTFYEVFNHSCDPNIFVISKNRQMVIVASRPIAEGEELCVSYGGFLYTDQGVIERIEYLYANHEFVCQCIVCLEDWPKEEILEKTALKFHNYITRKKAINELKTLIQPLLVDESSFKLLSVLQILHIVLDVCKWLFTNIKPPFYEHAHIQNLVYLFTSLRYDEFCQHCKSTDHKKIAYTILKKLAVRAGIEVMSAIPKSDNRSRKKVTRAIQCSLDRF